MKRYAFFDVDDTLIQYKSMFDFYRFWALEWIGSAALLRAFDNDFADRKARGESREDLNRAYYRHFAGARAQELDAAGETWARRHLESPERFFIASSVSELQRLKADGTVPVFVSGSFDAVLDPVARHLGVRDVLCAPLLFGPEGILTGEIGYPQTIGPGKATVIKGFLDCRNVDPGDCYAFGDDVSDLDMLAYVGHPVVVGTETPLARDARTTSWGKLTLAG